MVVVGGGGLFCAIPFEIEVMLPYPFTYDNHIFCITSQVFNLGRKLMALG